METLSNVAHRKPICDGIASVALPEAKSSQTGVSVRYVPAPDKQWYVLRASYGREDMAADFIIADGTYAYVAKHTVTRLVDGIKRKVQESLIPNLLFVYTSSEEANRYVKNTPPIRIASPSITTILKSTRG